LLPIQKARLLQLGGRIPICKSRLKLAAQVAKGPKVDQAALAAVSDENCKSIAKQYDRMLELKRKQADLDLRRAVAAR